MELNTKEILKITKEMDLEYLNGLMAKLFMVNGRMESSTGKESS